MAQLNYKLLQDDAKRKILFWGASNLLKDFLADKHFPNVVGIIDMDSQKWGADFCGYKIFSPYDISNINPDKIYISFISIKDSYNQLKKELRQKFPNIEVVDNFVKNKKYYCPYCQKEQHFIDYGRPVRQNVCCIECGSLERHRFLYYVYEKFILNIKQKKLRILHTAPEKSIYELFSKQENIEYYSIDLFPEKYRYAINCQKMNVLDLKFENDYFDFIITNHVVEHVLDEKGFFSELLRVLKHDGKIILTTPYYNDLDITFEDASIVTPEDREKYYGQVDHVRKYGKDIFDRFSQYGRVQEISPIFFISKNYKKNKIKLTENSAIIIEK